ncbi:imelysin family protein [Hyunsoonleella pacifica]|uniref:Imelysin-like domain-containing protein n=1 Tax=Hyunsoonleella pacifica TaxID=1080224 RepID=A0A4Q9FWR0_9FLAO|nr:imelysin family protein [Hyunsoonleella pacifica]TBN18802.1 hypothetical protein EYD46_01685 [Hyunsoonleella pacifica]GGD04847.1 hypothetical protein GCM10011368_03380 [Hyunsoonleella pacifica]
MKYLIVVFTFILITTSCKSNDDTEIIMNNDFYQSYYEENILLSLEKFTEELEVLKQYVLDFETSNSDIDYDKLTTQWLVTAKAYSRAEIYNFGLIKQRFFDINIYNYPINTTQIENNITEEANYDANYFTTKSTVIKGLGTLEYLLFKDFNPKIAKAELLNDTSRLDYVLGVTDELIRQANLMINTWQTEYLNIYTNANESLCSNNAKCLTINQIINVLDVAKVTKIGKPSGFEKSDNVSPNSLEAYRSRNSLALIEAILSEVEYVYFTSKTNISSLVNSIDNTNKISTQIQNKLNTIDQEIILFNNNLHDGITSNPESIRPIYNALKELNILFAVDISSILSITVLPTDNDGD